MRAISDRLTDDAMAAVDCGTATSWYARDLSMRPPQLGSLAGLLLSIRGGMPYAIAAKNAHPDRPVLAMIGDGAMQMNGVNELITVKRYWQGWADPRFVVLVLNNRELHVSRCSRPPRPSSPGTRRCSPSSRRGSGRR